jgi:hypothetical protein
MGAKSNINGKPPDIMNEKNRSDLFSNTKKCSPSIFAIKKRK